MSDDLTVLDGIGERYADRLRDAGIESFADLADADVDALADELDVETDRVADWRDAAADRVDDADDSTEESDDDGSTDEAWADEGSDDAAPAGPLEIRQTVEETAGDVIGRPLDGVAEIRQTEDGWIVQVDVVERPAVPDSQDILGLYELTLDGSANMRGYERLRRYRRSDTEPE